MIERIERLRKQFSNMGVDSMIVQKPENRRYLSGFTGSAGILFITESTNYLITDFRYLEQAAMESVGFEIVKHGDKIIETLSEIITSAKSERMGFEKDYMTFSVYDSLRSIFEEKRLVPIDGEIEKLRSVKDGSEIEKIENALRIADESFDYMCSIIKPGLSEKDAATELEYYMKKNGSQKNSFSPIIASGPRASLPHAQPTERVFEMGDMVKMDFGATYDGYCSDLTRTVFIGSITPEQKKVYEIVRSAQESAIAAISPDKEGAKIDSIARDYIASQGYGDKFGHGLGHGLGLFIHEAPRLSQSSTDILSEGNVVTVEPGIYISGWGGIRIEDVILVTAHGHKNLTRASKEIIII